VTIEELTMDVETLLTTTRSVRRRLDLERPVDRAVLRECLAIALQAPNGSNRQSWRWIVVTDAETRAALARLYRDAHALAVSPGMRDGGDATTPEGRIARSVDWLADHLDRVPALIVACVAQYLRPAPGRELFAASTLYGSIYPAVWNLQLALHSRGLGSCPTTLLLLRVEAVRQLLGIPDAYVPACMLPVAPIAGDAPLRPAPRAPVDDVVGWDGWDSD
jgi:nitroreductase